MKNVAVDIGRVFSYYSILAVTTLFLIEDVFHIDLWDYLFLGMLPMMLHFTLFLTVGGALIAWTVAWLDEFKIRGADLVLFLSSVGFMVYWVYGWV
jgi:hypothetical protein